MTQDEIDNIAVYCLDCKKKGIRKDLERADGSYPFIYDGSYRCEECEAKERDMSEKCFNRECTDGENSDSGCKRFNAGADMERYCGDYMYNPLLPLARESIDDLEKDNAALTTERDTLRGALARIESVTNNYDEREPEHDDGRFTLSNEIHKVLSSLTQATPEGG